MEIICAIGGIILYYCLISAIAHIWIPNRSELNSLRLDKTIDYDNLNSKQKRLCLKRLRYRESYKKIANELVILNREINKG